MLRHGSRGVAGPLLLAVLVIGSLPLGGGVAAGVRRPEQVGGANPTGPPVSTYNLSGRLAYPLGVTTDGRGNVWFAEDNSDAIAEFVPVNSTFRTFDIPTPHHLAWIWFLVFDDRGNLWFADDSQQLVWRFAPGSGEFANFTAGSSYPFVLRYDQTRNRLWFTSLKTNQFGYFALGAGGAVLERVENLSAPLPGTGVSGIVTDSVGNVYVAESFQAKIIEFNGDSLAVVKTWALPSGSQPVGLALDESRGRLWFTNHASSFFGFVGLDSPTIAEYATSLLFASGSYEVTLPYWIYVSATGMVWFDEHIANRIARFDPTSLRLTEFDVPTIESSPLMLSIDDQRGTVWFTEFAGNALGRVAEDSSVSASVEISYGNADADPSAIVVATFLPSPSSSPTVSLTADTTGAPGSAFEVSTQASESGYRIQFTANQAKPGNYTAGICAQYAYTAQCGYAPITVPQPGSAFATLTAVYVAAGAGVALLVFAIVRQSRREGGRLRPARPWERLARMKPAALVTATARATAGIMTSKG